MVTHYLESCLVSGQGREVEPSRGRHEDRRRDFRQCRHREARRCRTRIRQHLRQEVLRRNAGQIFSIITGCKVA